MDLTIRAGGGDIPVSTTEALQLHTWLRTSGLTRTSKEFDDAMAGARARQTPTAGGTGSSGQPPQELEEEESERCHVITGTS